MTKAVNNGNGFSVNGKPPDCAGCPLAVCKTCGGDPHNGEDHKYLPLGKGFALDYGNPAKAKLAVMLEAPGRSEIDYDLRHGIFNGLDAEELQRRALLYPKVPERFRSHGAALVGASWFLLSSWALQRFGVERKDLFIGNVLRCLPPLNKQKGHYPIGKVRKAAEAFCRQYDRWNLFKPSIQIVTLHPASLMREVTPLPLFVRCIEKWRDAGLKRRAVLLAGGKAAKLWGYWEAVESHLGHYGFAKEPKIKFEDRLRLSEKKREKPVENLWGC